MSSIEKLRLGKPKIRKVKGVWCVYFSNAPGARNWDAWAFVNKLHMQTAENRPHYYYADSMPVGERGYL